MSWPKRGRDLPVTDLTADQVARSVSGALQDRFRDRRGAAKVIARAGRASVRQAKNWLAGRHAPQAAQLVALMREFDEVSEAVLELAGRGQPLTDEQRAIVDRALGILGGRR